MDESERFLAGGGEMGATRMIEGLAAGELDAQVQITYAPEGLRCHVQAPLSARPVP